MRRSWPLVLTILLLASGSSADDETTADRRAMLTANGMAPPKRTICDGSHRKIVCHFNGGLTLNRDLPANELLSYGPPAVAFTEGGDVHIVVQQCEIICKPEPARP